MHKCVEFSIIKLYNICKKSNSRKKCTKILLKFQGENNKIIYSNVYSIYLNLPQNQDDTLEGNTKLRPSIVNFQFYTFSFDDRDFDRVQNHVSLP